MLPRCLKTKLIAVPESCGDSLRTSAVNNNESMI